MEIHLRPAKRMISDTTTKARPAKTNPPVAWAKPS